MSLNHFIRGANEPAKNSFNIGCATLDATNITTDNIRTTTINGLGVIGNLFTQTNTIPNITSNGVYESLVGDGVGSMTVIADDLHIGTSLTMNLCGDYTSGSNDDMYFRVYGGLTGSDVLITSQIFNMKGVAVDAGIKISILLTIREVGPTSQLYMCIDVRGMNNSGTIIGSIYTNGSGTIDTTINNTFDLRVMNVQSGQSIHSDMFVFDMSR